MLFDFVLGEIVKKGNCMKYLLVDDEPIILEGMKMTVENVVSKDDVIFTANDPFEAIEIAKKEQIDVAFCDVDMPGMNGIKLAERIHEISEKTSIIFATGYAHYSLDAWHTAAEGFILKPVSEDEVKDVIKKVLSHKVIVRDDENVAKETSGQRQIIEARCFGNFELMYNNKPIHFARKRSKEMLAYLIDRKGSMVTTNEIRSILWEEEADSEEKSGYVRVLANDIRKAFDVIGVESILLNEKNNYSVDISRIHSDYFDFLEGDVKARRAFQGEYMTQYSWAEATLGRLLNMG